MILLFAFLVALFLTVVLVPPLARLATRLGLIDLPEARKVHTVPVPRCGGLAVFVGTAVPVLLYARFDDAVAGWLAGAVIVVVIGAIDDARPLHYGWKLAGQAAAVAAAMAGGAVLNHLPLFGIDPAPPWIAYPVTALFVVGVTNAVNLADGLDGLAGGIVVLSFSAIALLAYAGEGGIVLLIAVAASGAVIGFLRYNNFPAIVFLGDAGSGFLGYTAAVLAILLVERSDTALSPGIVALLVGLPLMDTGYAFLRRAASGRSPFRPDRRHVHHRLLALGLSQMGAVTAIYAVQAAMVGTALVLRYDSDLAVLGSFALISAITVGTLILLVRNGTDEAATVPTGAVIERRNLWLRRRRWLPAASIAVVKFGIIGFLLLGAMLPTAVPADVGVLALAAAGFRIAALTLSRERTYVLTRAIVYVAGGFAAYVVASAVSGAPTMKWMVGGYLALIVAALAVAVRVTRREQFRVLPQDLLILFLALAVPNLTGEAVSRYHVREVALMLIVLFYATEFVLARDPRGRRDFDIGAIACLAIIGARGLV